MKQIRYIAIMAAAILSAACTKEMKGPEETELTITASFAEESTRTTLDGASVLWEPGDEVKLFYKETGSRFTSTNTADAAVADFTGSLNVVVNFHEGFSASTPLYGLYPYRADATADNTSVTTTLLSEQTGKAGSFAKGMNISLAKSNSLTMGFYNVCGGVRFSVTRNDVKNVVFEALNGESIAGKVKLAFEGGVPAVQEVSYGKSSITLTAPAGDSFETGKWYYIVTLPGTLSGGFKMTFNTKTQYATLESSSSVKIKRSVFGSLADADEDLVYKDKDTPEYVDLGLSVKWATCNVGAFSPEDYGDLYAWGETSTKSVYSEATYLYCHGRDTDGDGLYDQKRTWDNIGSDISGTQYDVAHVRWGGKCRMPTIAECEELINNCTSTWTTDYNGTGVSGRIFTSNKEGYTDKSIFLPAAGSSYCGSLNNDGSSGNYWSSTFIRDELAWDFYFGSDRVGRWDYGRIVGRSVRPVCDK